eukprot:CAMPEP_0197524506 /NCGR_PEP_ID=MMETSP1318-20131121/9167_1 /TAXON_ID=552666 /ORGANISM="Partenskyella glossopodia, Strain RCC365" /LENGTH=233 /DNA_ID=CAMNT_0043077481 /DNA_START=133 /DNA_END=834 /DNA_ORIENTATION=-
MTSTFGSPPEPRALPIETVLSLGLGVEGGDMKNTTDIKGLCSASERRVYSMMNVHKTYSDQGVSLVELISGYFAEESIPDYRCSTCNQKAYCKKVVLPKELPPVLILQLKRFAPISVGLQIKCHRKVDVPRILELMDTSSRKSIYSLSSMVVHDGGMGGGHNMCYTRLPSVKNGGKHTHDEKKNLNLGTQTQNHGTQETQEWMWFSDRHIGPVSEEEIEAAEPYILFYERINV